MEESRFQFAFHKVEDDEGTEEDLVIGDWGGIGDAIDSGAQGREEEHWVDEDWANILDEVDGSPAELASCMYFRLEKCCLNPQLCILR